MLGIRSGGWFILVAAALWGTTGTTQALSPAESQPLAVGALRLVIAGAALLPYAFARRALPDPIRWQRLPTFFAALSLALAQPLFFSAAAITGVGLAAVVSIGSAPVIAGALEWVIAGERPNARWAFATALAVFGTALLFIEEPEAGVSGLGVLLALGAGATYGVYLVSSKRLLASHKPDAVIAVAFGLSALFLLPILLFLDLGWVFSAQGAIAMLYLGLVATALAYILFIRGLMEMPPSSAATLSLAEPLTAAALGVIVLGERLGPVAVVGAALLLSGLLIIGREPELRSDPAENSQKTPPPDTP